MTPSSFQVWSSAFAFLLSGKMAASSSRSQELLPLSTLMLETIGSNDSCYRHGENIQEECLVCQAICDNRDKMAACKERLERKDQLHPEVSVQARRLQGAYVKQTSVLAH